MVMGSAWRKNNLRELRRSLGRWLAILAIIALGIGFFAGLKASKPAMLLTAEDYLGETGFYDSPHQHPGPDPRGCGGRRTDEGYCRSGGLRHRGRRGHHRRG